MWGSELRECDIALRLNEASFDRGRRAGHGRGWLRVVVYPLARLWPCFPVCLHVPAYHNPCLMASFPSLCNAGGWAGGVYLESRWFHFLLGHTIPLLDTRHRLFRRLTCLLQGPVAMGGQTGEGVSLNDHPSLALSLPSPGVFGLIGGGP